ncbi:MAG: aminotransferase class V-fold PLP-dependent enzyme, partial [Acidobacteriota bacterium]|nr:aminotransferase class V-fold PLP-dependent enzyme [Acidobacteriota bacterium]
DGLRAATAQTINADPKEIAIVKNTSEGIAMVATGMQFRPGDRIVCFTEEFPANLFPWREIESTGVEVRWLSIYDELDKIDAATKGAKLLAISFVNYLSGYRVDLEKIGEICRRNRCFFFVDAIQGMGVFPIDVWAMNIDALAADGHKWMLGPEGCGVLYVRLERQEQIKPIQIGWTNFAHYTDYASRDMTLRPTAGRYESGTLNTIGCFGLRASLELLLEVGVREAGEATMALVDRLADGARSKGFVLYCDRNPQNGSGIVSIQKPGVDSAMLVKKLKDRGILAAPRQGWIRFAPHFYLSPADINRVIEELP